MKIAVLGAAGRIGYNTLFQLISDASLQITPNSLEISCIEVTPCLPEMERIISEIQDTNFSVLSKITTTDSHSEGLANCDFIIILSSVTKKPHEPRSIMLKGNTEIFRRIANSLNMLYNHLSQKFPFILVVSNPSNTMAWLLTEQLNYIPNKNIFSLAAMDSNRAIVLISKLFKTVNSRIDRLAIIGNHSQTTVVITEPVLINNISIHELENIIDKNNCIENDDLQKQVTDRNYRMVRYRGLGSCCSVASAIVQTIKFIRSENSSCHNKWFNIGLFFNGILENTKGKNNKLVITLPCSKDNNGSLVIPLETFNLSRKKQMQIDVSIDELEQEKGDVIEMIRK